MRVYCFFYTKPDPLYHLLNDKVNYKKIITECESERQCFFGNFQVCPLVEVSWAFLKKRDQGVDDNTFISLNNSIKSAPLLLYSRDHSPKSRSLVSYSNGLR